MTWYALYMRRIKKSFEHAVEGLTHAFQLEKNLQLFVPVYLLVLLFGAIIHLLTWEWLALLLSGAGFMAIELLNTAIERVVDVLDDQKKRLGRSHYAMLKAAKDVGAAASLIGLGMVILVVLIVFCPYIRLYVF